MNNHSTLVLNIKAGTIDFIGNFNRVCSNNHYYVSSGFRPVSGSLSVNEYHYEKHFDGEALAFLSELMPAMNVGNHDNSDIQSDYFDVSWYVDVNIGAWNKPYILEA